MYGLTMTNVRRLAYDLAGRASLNHRFDHNTKLAGREWLSGFTKLHSYLTIRLPTSTSLVIMNGFNQKAVKQFCFTSTGSFGNQGVWTIENLELRRDRVQHSYQTWKSPVHYRHATGTQSSKRRTGKEHNSTKLCECCWGVYPTTFRVP